MNDCKEWFYDEVMKQLQSGRFDLDEIIDMLERELPKLRASDAEDVVESSETVMMQGTK